MSRRGQGRGRSSLRLPGGGASFTPKNIAGLVIWLRADLGITTVSGKVSLWADQSGLGNDVANAAAGARPDVYNASDAAYAGKATVQSTATTNFLGNTVFTLAQPVTIYVVGEFSTLNAVLVNIGQAGISPQIFDNAANISGDAGLTINSGVAANTKHAICFVVNAASSSLGVDNFSTPQVSGNAGAGTSNGIGILGTATGIAPSIGKVAELCVYNTAHGATTRAQLGTYFARYGITVA